MRDLDLLPCPFCGATNVAQGASAEEISVWCFCGARGPSVDFPEVCIDPASKVQECRALWNARAPSTPDVANILALIDHHVTDDDDRMTLRQSIIAAWNRRTPEPGKDGNNG